MIVGSARVNKVSKGAKHDTCFVERMLKKTKITARP